MAQQLKVGHWLNEVQPEVLAKKTLLHEVTSQKPVMVWQFVDRASKKTPPSQEAAWNIAEPTKNSTLPEAKEANGPSPLGKFPTLNFQLPWSFQGRVFCLLP